MSFLHLTFISTLSLAFCPADIIKCIRQLTSDQWSISACPVGGAGAVYLYIQHRQRFVSHHPGLRSPIFQQLPLHGLGYTEFYCIRNLGFYNLLDLSGGKYKESERHGSAARICTACWIFDGWRIHAQKFSRIVDDYLLYDLTIMFQGLWRASHNTVLISGVMS